jgi:hypothetical protein
MTGTAMTKILKEAVYKYGDNQIIVCIEELSELQKELCKYLRNKGDIGHIAEEVANCEIMLKQMKIYFDCCQSVKIWKSSKIKRLKKMVQED